MRLSDKQRQALELEVVPSEARLELTRIIRDRCQVVHGDEDGMALLRENEFINMANQVLGKPIYTLEGGDWGEYHPAEHAWHHGQRELIVRLPTTSQLAEILADYLQRGMMNTAQVNAILTDYNCGFRFHDISGGESVNIDIKIVAPESIPDADRHADNVGLAEAEIKANVDLADRVYELVWSEIEHSP